MANGRSAAVYPEGYADTSWQSHGDTQSAGQSPDASAWVSGEGSGDASGDGEGSGDGEAIGAEQPHSDPT